MHDHLWRDQILHDQIWYGQILHNKTLHAKTLHDQILQLSVGQDRHKKLVQSMIHRTCKQCTCIK